MQPAGWNPPPQQPSYGQPPPGYPPQAQGYGAPAYEPAPAPAVKTSGAGDKGFFGALFDLSFSSFVTTKIIKVLYILWMLGTVLVLLGMVGAAIMQFTERYGSAVVGVLFLLASPFAAAFYLILGRLYLELVIVMFRIAETLNDINRKTKG